ncbi:MAG: PHP domain-containing protein [Candidatus Altiarchaeota archaeon]|nr:PHP domain-containing protein [Candidatus Altiarchaeota archaeon]
MRYDIHVHSSFSDGRSTPKEIVEHAKRIGLSGVAITDHDAIAGSLEALRYASKDFEVIPGMEVSSKDGHIIALDVKEVIPRDLSAKETVDRIHALGGIAIAAHPYDSWRNGVGDLILTAGFDAVEIENGHTLYNKKDVVGICKKHGLKMVGGTDAHLLEEVGSVTVECGKPFLEALKSGEIEVKSRNKAILLYNQGRFMTYHRLVKPLLKK